MVVIKVTVAHWTARNGCRVSLPVQQPLLQHSDAFQLSCSMVGGLGWGAELEPARDRMYETKQFFISASDRIHAAA